jgi:hypothetical protein
VRGPWPQHADHKKKCDDRCSDGRHASSRVHGLPPSPSPDRKVTTYCADFTRSSIGRSSVLNGAFGLSGKTLRPASRPTNELEAIFALTLLMGRTLGLTSRRPPRRQR